MINIREFRNTDLEWLVELNNACVPAVSFQTSDEFTSDMIFWHSAAVAIKDNKAVGIVILLREATGYSCENYAWLNQKYAKHLYIDRIIISEEARCLGVGRKLYEFAKKEAKKQGMPLTAEVNILPNNPQSHAFHKKLGFQLTGEKAHSPSYKVQFYKYDG